MNYKTVVAAFDFDGTLTRKDSLLPFLNFVRGPLATFSNLTLSIPTFASYAMNASSRQDVKEALLKRFLSSLPLAHIQELGKLYALNCLPQLIKPAAQRRLQSHLMAGHRCVLVSANVDIYLKAWATANGFHDTIVSECEVASGMLTGKLSGKNCWGQEKAERLTKLLGPRQNYILYAYGDSRGDKEMLEMADYPFFRTMPEGDL